MSLESSELKYRTIPKCLLCRNRLPAAQCGVIHVHVLLYEGSIRAAFIQSVQVFTTKYLCSYVNTRILAVLYGEEVCCLSELGTQYLCWLVTFPAL